MTEYRSEETDSKDKPNLIELTKQEPKVKQEDHSAGLRKTKENKKDLSSEMTNQAVGTYIITKVQAQKAKNRFNIFINDEYAFPVDDNLLVQHRLVKGKELTKADIDELKEKGELSKGYQAALHYLNFKMRSEKEIIDYLVDKEYETIDPIIDKLKTHRLIDDEAYAKSFVRTNSLLKLEGPKKVERALFAKGLSKANVLAGLDEYSLELQEENALKLAEKVGKRQRNKSSIEISQKIREQLMLKGFDQDITQRTIDELDTDLSESEEYDALKMQGEKAWTRYARKYSGYDLKQKTKAYLYSKRYPTELIDQFIQEKEESY
ncbi:Regulatory protein recX [Alkalibacterium sp. AK22]|uniref:recombination regulator RecX n=1 Tax=Alkalibacterium sp. AK22 TaxID=1229520 RepID=UPI00044C8F70|nr:recombination regulator RecX [Alkalibacterium sp. AK22]EXJ22628.1 Regulatory protein recX [Alkalibacterium sp. AK22]